MSLGITACMVVKACADQQAYTGLVERMRYNVEHGAFTIHPCPHEPRCDATEEVLEEMTMCLLRDVPGLERFLL